MIKAALVRLDGTTGDEFRLAAAERLARMFQARIVGLILNVLPEPVLAEGSASGSLWTATVDNARAAGEELERAVGKRLNELSPPAEVRRFDLFASERPRIAARECRMADVYVGLSLSDADRGAEPHDIIEGVLFESGRHVFLSNENKRVEDGFEHVIVAWNSSREAARAVSEALPYLQKARAVTILTIERGSGSGAPVKGGRELVDYLGHHGIGAAFNVAEERGRDTSSTLIAEIGERKADLLVMGGYGHSRLREWLLGGVTHDLLRKSPVSLVVAH